MFAAGKRPRDVVQAIEGVTPERARALWDLFCLDDEPQPQEGQEALGESPRARSVNHDEEERREREAYDASVEAWTREQTEARVRAEEERERESREHDAKRSRRRAMTDLPTSPSSSNAYAIPPSTRAMKPSELAERATPVKLDASELLVQLITRLTSTDR